jgi:membrane dipeptidase
VNTLSKPASRDPERAIPNDAPLVDGHLDLAENVTLFGRDLTTSVAEIRAKEGRTEKEATVSLPELERGGVAVVCATVTPGFKVDDVGEDFEPHSAIYYTPEQAEAQALAQIALYEQWERQGRVRLLKSVRDLDDHLSLWKGDRKPGLVMLMESADPIVNVRDLPRWWERGLRIIGLTYGDTAYAAGVPGSGTRRNQGGLTALGMDLMERMAALGFTWDISHLADEGIWQGLEMDFPRVCASHANARAIVHTERQLEDDAIRAVAGRGGVIGLVLYDGFLDPRWRMEPGVRVTLGDQVRKQAEYVASLAGWEHVGIGSDLDGGFGKQETPEEIDSEADLYKIAAVLPPEARVPVLGRNWLNFLRASLPVSGP